MVLSGWISSWCKSSPIFQLVVWWVCDAKPTMCYLCHWAITTSKYTHVCGLCKCSSNCSLVWLWLHYAVLLVVVWLLVGHTFGWISKHDTAPRFAMLQQCYPLLTKITKLWNYVRQHPSFGFLHSHVWCFIVWVQSTPTFTTSFCPTWILSMASHLLMRYAPIHLRCVFPCTHWLFLWNQTRQRFGTCSTLFTDVLHHNSNCLWHIEASCQGGVNFYDQNTPLISHFTAMVPIVSLSLLTLYRNCGSSPASLICVSGYWTDSSQANTRFSCSPRWEAWLCMFRFTYCAGVVHISLY